MFTGLVQTTGTIVESRASASGVSMSLEVADWPEAGAPPLSRGESIAVNGVCLTLARLEATPRAARLGFDVIHETLRVTTLGRLAVGSRVNLERAATPATLLGGHLVQGHVDTIARVAERVDASGERRLRCALPQEFMRYLIQRGSIALEGVSLTIAHIDDRNATFDVCLIPETLQRTTLGEIAASSELNVEVDCVAKMVERLAGRA